MNKKLSILGCGWLGFPLAISLIQKGYQINGSVTSPHKLKRLKENGINSFIVDIGKTTNNYNEFLDANVLIIAIPPRNIEFFKMLLKNIEKVNLKKVLFISSISVYPLSNEIVTEETSIDQSPLSEIEALFKSSKKCKTTILRFGGLFGYDRKPGNFIRKGQKLKNPEGHVNLIHRDDCIQIIQGIIHSNIWGETFNACTDSHPKRKEFYKNEILKIGGDEPLLDLDSENRYKIVSSEKLKTMLNFSFKYSDLLNLSYND